MTENMVPATSRERGRDVGSEHPASQARAPPLRPPRTQQGPGPRRPALLLAARLSTPTHQLDALRKGVVHPVLLWEALQDLALAFPTP